MKVKEDSKKGKRRGANPYGQSSPRRKIKTRVSDANQDSEELASEEEEQANYYRQDQNNQDQDNQDQGNSEKQTNN